MGTPKVDLSTEIKGMLREQMRLIQRLEEQRRIVAEGASVRAIRELKQLEAIEKEFNEKLHQKVSIEFLQNLFENALLESH